MKRKMIGAAAAYMSGLFFASFFTGGSDLLLLAGLLPIFFIICAAIKLPKSDVILLLTVFAVAFTCGSLYERFVYDKITSYSGKNVDYIGEITDVEYYSDAKALYTLDGKINSEINARITYFGDAYDADIGDILSFENCTLSFPEKDYLFDAQSYYKSSEIFLTIDKAEKVTFTQTDSHIIKRAINLYRDRITSEFVQTLGKSEGGFLSGLVFGITDNIGDAEKNLLYRCGIGHIMSVSGLHVSIIAALLMTLLQRLGGGRYLSFAVMNVFLVLMIIMVKSPISAIRSAIMLDFIYGAKILRRQNDSLNSLSMAVLLICLSNPFVIFDRGFLLSISGTYGIAVFGPYMTRAMKSETLPQKFLKSAATMLSVMLVIMPLNVLYFEESSIISPIVNLLFVPLCVAAMVIGVVYALSGGLLSMLSVSGLLIKWVNVVTDFIGRVEFFHFSSGNSQMFILAMIFSAAVIGVYALFKNRKLTALTLAGAFSLFFFTSATNMSIQRNKLKAVVLGRGENAVVIVTYKGTADVIDLSGHHKSPDYVRKYLASNGINELNSLVLTNDINAQYAAYENSLTLVKINSLLVAGESENVTENFCPTYISDECQLRIQNKNYELEYTEGELKISSGELKLEITNVNSPESDADLAIRYGRITNNSEIYNDSHTIYLDSTDKVSSEFSGYNNFEIEISAIDGKYEIRRL